MAKTIVITGITRGIGRGLVEEFDRLGHKVIGCGRSTDQVSELQNALGPEHHLTSIDVTDDALVAEAGASRAILAGELRAQVRIKVNTLERGKILRPGCAEAPAIGEGGGTERRARGLDPTAMPS